MVNSAGGNVPLAKRPPQQVAESSKVELSPPTRLLLVAPMCLGCLYFSLIIQAPITQPVSSALKSRCKSASARPA